MHKKEKKEEHLKIKTHACNKCSHLFGTTSDRDRHMKSCNRNVPDEERLQCMECEKSYIQRNHLLRHVRAVHFKIRPYMCHICDRNTFTSTTALNEHIKGVHTTERSYKCTFCNYASAYGNNT